MLHCGFLSRIEDDYREVLLQRNGMPRRHHDTGRTAVLDLRSKEGAMDREQVLDEYRNGDEGKRLSLFLAYRDLRDDFTRVEEEIPHDDFLTVSFPWSRKHHVERAA